MSARDGEIHRFIEGAPRDHGVDSITVAVTIASDMSSPGPMGRNRDFRLVRLVVGREPRHRFSHRAVVVEPGGGRVSRHLSEGAGQRANPSLRRQRRDVRADGRHE